MKAAFVALAIILGAGFANAQYAAWQQADHEHTKQELQHSGGTDAAGCHHDRKNGGYHCH